jgi:hypothetical protein
MQTASIVARQAISEGKFRMRTIHQILSHYENAKPGLPARISDMLLLPQRGLRAISISIARRAGATLPANEKSRIDRGVERVTRSPWGMWLPEG